ncbi:hypothetical protein KEM48_013713 [Puccinia striiformis f. sp. tritici PST-130]|nr:hypothetical protein KEM48_013713 [Puccinia striiformis f. sp. tritici PST-130]
MSDAAANGASEELKQALSLDSLFGLKGLVAVVTGGGTGLPYGALMFSLRPIRMMACELANSQIRFNSIAPGVFPSEMPRKSDIRSRLMPRNTNPAGRPGRPGDGGKHSLPLRKGGQYCDGLVMNVDGGILLTNPSAC